MLQADGFVFLVLAGDLRDRRVLHLERGSKRSSRGPVYEPFMEYRTLSLGNSAGIDYTVVGQLVISEQEGGQPVQRVVIVTKYIADVIWCRISMSSPELFQHGCKFHFFT